MNRSSIEIRCDHVGRNDRRDPVWLDMWHNDGGWWSSAIAAAPEVNRGEVRETKRGWEFTCPTCGLRVAVRHSRLVVELSNRSAAGETTLDLRKLREASARETPTVRS